MDENHAKRIRSELVKAGMTSYGLLKGESRHLPELIHEDEHIGGVVYGRYSGGSGMIVATDKRVLFLDYKPFYHSTDEIKYDVISGVSVNQQDGTAGVVLHSRLGDYKLRFVNVKCATHFTHYIERKAVELETAVKPKPVKPKDVFRPTLSVSFAQDAQHFLWSHEVAVLSTVDANGTLHGSAVYYASDKNDHIFFVSKEKTKKIQNIHANPQVALTMYDTQTMQTLQVSGVAQVETEPEMKKLIQDRVLRPRFRPGGKTELPPILYIPAGDYVVVSVKPTAYTFADYK